MRIIIPALMMSLALASIAANSNNTVELCNDNIKLKWTKSTDGWTLASTEVYGVTVNPPILQNGILFSSKQPSDTPIDISSTYNHGIFPEPEYRYITSSWNDATNSVALNSAGILFTFLPDSVVKTGPYSIATSHHNNDFSVIQNWEIKNNNIDITVTLTAGKEGWYSISSPSIMAVDNNSIDYAIIPGVLHGSEINSDFCRAYAYGWGIPDRPVVYRERSVSTLTSILTGNNGITLAATAHPGTAAEPWGTDRRNKNQWLLGLSAMNRNGEITPTLYHPVIGQDESFMKAGESKSFNITLSVGNNGWWPMFCYIANNIYRFEESLSKRYNSRSLTERLYGLHRYLVNDSTSRWHTIVYNGDTIGAQEYLGGVYLAKKDAMKNADYGAMWMLGHITGDSLIIHKRLPYALNFKLSQNNTAPGFFHGASRGQYYLRNARRFVEEWGPYTEPIATTYYMLMDLGNIALFEPDNEQIKGTIKSSADWLLNMQKKDGSWAVAYNDSDFTEVFTDLADYRPTFYGLLIAYRILGDPKYLNGAKQGADWLIANAVKPTRWLGVCGDTRFAPDFATAQAAQALLEMYDVTQERSYLDAAITTARFYATSVYTNPIASYREITVYGTPLQQWQITTSGLSYEHGGVIGSTNLHGPILLASHAGMFVRMYKLTGEKLFLNMARCAAIGRDAFVDDTSMVASYYWNAMNKGAGPYPHHAWWQVGWITDYLMAELELRSNGKIRFPAGFITPKVGPHRTYGFGYGTVAGDKARLVMIPEAFSTDNPNIETILAANDHHIYVMLMNDLGQEQSVILTDNHNRQHSITIGPYGLETIKLSK